jgi:hypothetical protein
MVGWMGVDKLGDLYARFSALMPLELPSGVGKWIGQSLPLIFSVFISLVSSVSAVLIGALWIIAGAVEALERRSQRAEAPEYAHPDAVAEALRRSEPQHVHQSRWLARLLVLLWPRARYMSPCALEICKEALWTVVKLILLIFAVAIVVSLLAMTPRFLATFKQDLVLVIPSAGPLYALIGVLVAINVIIALGLLPYRMTMFSRRCWGIPVRGGGDPNVFFALLEEGCRLLSPRGQGARRPQRPIRLTSVNETRPLGSLVEASLTPDRSVGRPVAYLCLPLMVVFLVMGFSRLIDFQRPVVSVPYGDFFAYYLFDYVMEVVFSFGMILAGLHMAEWARRLFGVRTFRSWLVFCHVTREPEAAANAAKRGTARLEDGNDQRGEVAWQVLEDVDERFARWAKDPGTEERFNVEVCWAQVVSEADSDESPRHVVKAEPVPGLDDAMARILALPFHVRLSTEEWMSARTLSAPGESRGEEGPPL